MGQYFHIINLDKAEYLHPHKFGCGLKFREFISTTRMFEVLVYLTSDGLDTGDEYCGRWAGDRIVTAGDYGNKIFDIPSCPNTGQQNAYGVAVEAMRDISDDVIRALVAWSEHCACASIDLKATGWRD